MSDVPGYYIEDRIEILGVKRLRETAKLPVYMKPGDTGMDVCTVEPQLLGPGERHVFRTGLAFVIPHGFGLEVRPRSGLASRGVIAAFGTIDEGYRGEVCVTIINHGLVPIQIEVGDRIAQLVFVPVWRPELLELDELPTDTERGTAGFGSTGK